MCSVLHLQITSAHVHTRLVKANVVLHFDCGLHVCTRFGKCEALSGAAEHTGVSSTAENLSARGAF